MAPGIGRRDACIHPCGVLGVAFTVLCRHYAGTGRMKRPRCRFTQTKG